MIINNYRVMRKIEEEYQSQPLSMYLLQNLQSQLTEKTLDKQYNPGELRKDSDEIVVYYDKKIAHIPPKADFVKSELERLITYANDDADFVHPVIKAIQLHFWIGYLHPFPDGNGRLARSIFYWYLFKHGYWAIGFLPISATLKRSQHDYAYSYIYAEQDGLDFTYFYDFNMRKIMKAIEDFEMRIERKAKENQEVDKKVRAMAPELNERQIHTLKFLTSSEDASTSGTSYSVMHGVVLRTAYRDLKELEKMGFVESHQNGKMVSYMASEKARRLLLT